MTAEWKQKSAREAATRNQRRLIGIEPLESRLFCDHGLADAVASAEPRTAARTAIIAHAGSSLATAQNLGLLTQTVSYRGALAQASLNEYFKFTVSAASTISLSLTALTGNADLQLIKAAAAPSGSPQVIATSAHGGKTNESIGKQAPPGTYFVRVFESGGTVGYMLTLGVSSTTAKTPTTTGKLHIVFNYTYDKSGFFAGHPQAEALLNQAAGAFEVFTNALTAIAPGNGNSWNETFNNPGDPSSQITLNNPSVAGNTIVIYVGASGGLATSELGLGDPGGWSAMGSLNWINTVAARGQAGAFKENPTGFGPWGGSISFSDTTDWNLTTAAPTAGQNDFLSVATHEISHVLGFGTSASWYTFVSGTNFAGPHAKAANGGKAVPLAPGLQHWANNFQSTVNGVTQYAVMDPYLITGTRRAFTLLDYAGLEDVGWTV